MLPRGVENTRIYLDVSWQSELLEVFSLSHINDLYNLLGSFRACLISTAIEVDDLLTFTLSEHRIATMTSNEYSIITTLLVTYDDCFPIPSIQRILSV